MKQKDSIKDYLLELPNYLSLFIFPLFFLFLSPILLEISESTGIEVRDLNLIFTFFTIGSGIGQLTAILFNRKYKSLVIIVASFIILIPVTMALAWVKDKYSFYILYFIGGYFLGVVWLQVNQNILNSRIKNKERLTTITLSFFPAGAIIAPYISSAIVRRGIEWQTIYYILVLLIILAIILYLTITRKIDYHSLKPDIKISFKDIFISRKRNIIFILILLMMAAYIIAQTIVVTWVPTFFRVERFFTVGDVAFVGALLWIGVIAGRILSIIVADKIKAQYLILIMSGIAFISTIIIYFLENKNTVYVMMVMIGFGFSAIFPFLISSGSVIYSSGTGLLLTIIYMITNLGAAIAPALIKYLSQFGMQTSVLPVPIFMLIFIMLAIIMIIYSRLAGIQEEIL